ncbi:MAG: carboxylating nicotinate-nucleotide diphosphorylase [Nitrospiraceae bacterium]
MNARAAAAPLDPEVISRTVAAALAEDLPQGDITTDTLFPSAVAASGAIVAKQSVVVAGVAVARETFRQVDTTLKIVVAKQDGDRARAGETVLTVEGDGRAILKGERVTLNFMQRLSGIATLTAQFCDAVHGTGVTILDTRKTTPGLRAFEKWAVRLGGGRNHRLSLSDAAMVKDNHLVLGQRDGRSLADCARRIREQGPRGLRITIEVDRLDQIEPVLAGHPDVILLDNMTPAQVRQAVGMIGARAETEVSGGIRLETIRDYAAARPTYISIGALTHSAPAVDLSLDFTVRDAIGAKS